MDLGISGRNAIVCAASKGLGRGCAEALAGAGVSLVINARGAEALEATAAAIRDRHGVSVTAVAADITTPEGRAAVLAAGPSPDILVTNAGGPPPGMWSDWSRDDFIKALDGNMLTPIAMMQAVLPAMMERGWGRVVNITSQSVRAPIPTLGLSNAARTGLTGFVAGTSRQVAAQRGDDQQPAAGHPRHRPRRGARRAGGARRGHHPRRGPCPASGDDPGPALRHARRVRRGLRLPLLGSCGVHRRPEHPARRRRHQPDHVSKSRAGNLRLPASPSRPVAPNRNSPPGWPRR